LNKNRVTWKSKSFAAVVRNTYLNLTRRTDKCQLRSIVPHAVRTGPRSQRHSDPDFSRTIRRTRGGKPPRPPPAVAGAGPVRINPHVHLTMVANPPPRIAASVPAPQPIRPMAAAPPEVEDTGEFSLGRGILGAVLGAGLGAGRDVWFLRLAGFRFPLMGVDWRPGRLWRAAAGPGDRHDVGSDCRRPRPGRQWRERFI